MRRPIPLCLAVLTFSAVDAAAETIVFDTAQLTTSGVFFCLKEPACSASGNMVTLGSGADAVTLTFTGVSTLVPISNEALQVDLGTFSASSSSATFPTRTNELLPIVGFNLSLLQSAPVADSDSNRMLFGPGGHSELGFMMGSALFTLNPGTVPNGYGSMAYTLNPFVFSIPMNGSLHLTADAGVVPEPATMFLMGMGLAGAAVRRWRTARPGREASQT